MGPNGPFKSPCLLIRPTRAEDRDFSFIYIGPNGPYWLIGESSRANQGLRRPPVNINLYALKAVSLKGPTRAGDKFIFYFLRVT